jgi:Asp/Glu/hydantoin racemase
VHLNVVNPNTTAAMTQTIAAAARRVARMARACKSFGRSRS